MTLNEIRNVPTFEALKPAIRFLCDTMQDLSWGEFVAYQRTIETQAKKVGASLKILNEYAEQYQVFGYEESKQ